MQEKYFCPSWKNKTDAGKHRSCQRAKIVCHSEDAKRPWESVSPRMHLFFVKPAKNRTLWRTDCHTSGAPRSESIIAIFASGNHTTFFLRTGSQWQVFRQSGGAFGRPSFSSQGGSLTIGFPVILYQTKVLKRVSFLCTYTKLAETANSLFTSLA